MPALGLWQVMSWTDSTDSTIILMLLAAFLSLSMLLALVYVRRLQKVDQQHIKDTQQLQRLLQGQLIVMGQRVLALEKELQQRAQQPPVIKPEVIDPKISPVPKSNTSSYELTQNDASLTADAESAAEEDLMALARQLLEAGERPDLVADRCGLSQSEIDLLQAMYQPTSA